MMTAHEPHQPMRSAKRTTEYRPRRASPIGSPLGLPRDLGITGDPLTPLVNAMASFGGACRRLSAHRRPVVMLLRGFFAGALLVLPIGLASPSPHGQAPPVPPKKEQKQTGARVERSEQEEEREAVEQEIRQTVQLLLQAYEWARDIGDPVVRIRSFAALAEALWEHEPSLARQLFRMAFEETTHIPAPKRPKDIRAWIGTSRSPIELRQQILAKVGRLDPLFAAELAKSPEIEKNEREELEQDPEARRMRQALGSERTQALMSVATLLLEKDPKSAADAAAAALQEGVTQSFVMFLMRLRAKDPALADQLFDQALRTIARHTPARLHELIPLGSYVAADWHLPIRLGVGSEPPPVNPTTAARYLSVLLEALGHHIEIALNPTLAPEVARTDWFTAPQTLYGILLNLRAPVQRYLPDRAAVVDGLLNRLALTLSARTQAEIHTEEQRRTLSPEEKIADFLRHAERTSRAEERDELLFQAILEASNIEHFETAAALVPRLSDVKQRADVADFVYYHWAKRALEKGDLETARRTALELNNPERLVLMCGSLARRLEERKESEAALALLQEAESRIRRLPPSIEKARALILLAEAFLPLESDRAFETFAQAIGPLNRADALTEVVGANFQLNFMRTGVALGIAERDLMPMLERVVAAMTAADSARTLMLLPALENPPLRLIAHIAYGRRHLELLREKKAKLSEKIRD
jgi:hypothetical protein